LKEIALTELKPIEVEYSVFLWIQEVASWVKLLDKAQLSPNYKNTMLHGFHKICVALNRRPEKLTIEEASDFIEDCRKTEEHGQERPPVDYDIARRALRSWFMVQKGVSGNILKAKGISGELGKGFGSRANDRLTIEQRHAFYEALRSITHNNRWADRSWVIGGIGFITYRVIRRLKEKDQLHREMKLG